MKLWVWILIAVVVGGLIGWYAKNAQAKGKLFAFTAGAATGAAAAANAGTPAHS